jgi:hypothetical protein
MTIKEESPINNLCPRCGAQREYVVRRPTRDELKDIVARRRACQVAGNSRPTEGTGRVRRYKELRQVSRRIQ